MNLYEMIEKEKKKDYFLKLMDFLEKEYQTKTIYPPKQDIFKAFENINKVKIVLIGQDPYHTRGFAHGLAFSVKTNTIPKSLENIFKELENDLSIKRTNGDLTNIAKQGVLFLNTILTVAEQQPLSHKKKGWEKFTNAIIEYLNEDESPKVFMLWGSVSQKLINLITNPLHLVLTSSHPSPLSAYIDFFGCKHFSKANAFLESHNLTPIDWSI